MWPSTGKPTQLETAAALYVLDVLNLRTAAMISSATEDEVEAAVSSPAVEAECLRLQSDNRVTELRAAHGLDAVVERLVSGISELESQSGLIRTGDFLFRISGLQERRAAAAKANAPYKPSFSFAIVLKNEDGTKRVIRVGGGKTDE